jgi:tetratricopeptide (TPR) repeat protein
MAISLEDAVSAFRSGGLQRAIELADAALKPLEAANDTCGAWRFRCVKAQSLSVMGSFREALSLLREHESAAEPEIEVRRKSLAGFLRSRIGQFAIASHHLQRAESVAVAARLHVLLAQLLLYKAALFFYLGDTAELEKCTRRSLKLAEQQKNPFLIGCATGGIGKVYMVKGQAEEAIELYEEALAIFLLQGAELYASGIRSEMGCCYLALRNEEKALPLFSQALEFSVRVGEVTSQHIDLANLGVVHLRRGEYSKAISNFQKAVEIARGLGDSISASKWLGNLSLAYRNMGNSALALVFQKQSEELSAQVERARAALA